MHGILRWYYVWFTTLVILLKMIKMKCLKEILIPRIFNLKPIRSWGLTLLVILLLTACSKDSENNPDPGPSPDTAANKKSVGQSANDLLSDAQFDELRLEVLYVAGQSPTSGSITNLENFINEYFNKPAGVVITQREISIENQNTYTVSDIIEIEDANRQEFNSGSSIAVTAIFLDGEYAGNTENGSVLGIAYRNTSFVIFEATIREFSQQVFAPSLTTLESTVIQHELGHLMGLVNNGTSLQSNHHDSANGAHCNVDGCLMYWQAETGEGLLNMLSGGSVAQLDAQCQADLTANGGK